MLGPVSEIAVSSFPRVLSERSHLPQRRVFRNRCEWLRQSTGKVKTSDRRFEDFGVDVELRFKRSEVFDVNDSNHGVAFRTTNIAKTERSNHVVFFPRETART